MSNSSDKKVASNQKHSSYRQAADRIWEMAKEYERMGLTDLATTLKDIATEIHGLARAKHVEDLIEHANKDV